MPVWYVALIYMADTGKQPEKADEKLLGSNGKKSALKRKKKSDTKAEEVRLIQIYETYCLWRSLPMAFLYEKKNGQELLPEEIQEKHGIEDETIISLIGIRNQTQFCERFNVAKNTLSNWNKHVKTRDVLSDIRRWANTFTKNVTKSLYDNAMSKGGTSFKDRENFFKIVSNWNEKMAIEHNVGESLLDILKKGLSKNANINRK